MPINDVYAKSTTSKMEELILSCQINFLLLIHS